MAGTGQSAKGTGISSSEHESVSPPLATQRGSWPKEPPRQHHFSTGKAPGLQAYDTHRLPSRQGTVLLCLDLVHRNKLRNTVTQAIYGGNGISWGLQMHTAPEETQAQPKDPVCPAKKKEKAIGGVSGHP